MSRPKYIEESRLPPQDTTAEEYVIGGIALWPLAMDKVAFITEEMFYKQKNRLIFKAAKSLQSKGMSIDIITLKSELERMDALVPVGGLYELMQITNKSSTDANIVFHARIIQQMYIKREAIRIGGDIVQDAYDPSSDALEIVSKMEDAVYRIIEDNLSEKGGETRDDIIKQIKDDVKRAQSGEAVGISSGNPDIDEFFTFEDGMIYTWAGRSGSGKSSLVLTQVVKHALSISPVAVASLEMPVKQTMKWLAMSYGAENRTLKYGRFVHDDLDVYNHAMEEISKLDIHFTLSNELNEMLNETKVLIKEKKIRLLVIDYIQQVRIKGSNGSNRNSDIDTIMSALKAFAKKYSIPIIVLSQLNRQVEARPDKIPILSDLRDSGALEQLSDCVAFIYRAEYYDENWFYQIDGEEVPCKGIVKLIVAKNKDGATGSCYIRYNTNLKIWSRYKKEEEVASAFDDIKYRDYSEPMTPNKTFEDDVF